MAYTDYFDEVQELYIAYYQRPADPEGLVFWAKELDKAGGNLNGIIEAFANSAESRALYGAVIDSSNIDTVITGIYQALFNRLPDEGGLLFYHNGFIEGKFTAATIMLNILDGATGQDRYCIDNKLAAANLFTETIDPDLDGNDIQAAYTDADLVSARAYLDFVTDDPGTVPTEAEAANFIRDKIAEAGDPISGSQTFTLQEIEDEVITLPGTLVEGSQLMWGYTPEDKDTYGDGIPAEDMLSFLTTITGLDLTELGLIDNDGVGPFDNVASIELELEGALETGDIETGDLTITFENGTSLSFLTDEAAISEMYFDFLTNLLFFEDPITGVLVSRLYMSDPVWVDADGNYIDGPTYTELIVGEPIVLTPQENNGGTLEEGFTTEMDTTIVAGRLELLHQAYIDAGGGYDILEVDAKGTYAQPLALLNIEEIQVQNLPNVYTATKTVYDYTDQNGECVYGSDCAPTYEGYNPDNDPNYNERIVTYSTYPDRTIDIGVAPGNLDSVLDLSRATAIEKLIVTEGRDTGMELGDLTVVGIRNGATARFEGGFTQDVTLHYGEGLTGELNVELAIGDIYSDINLLLLHNAAVLNIDSQGIENHMHSFFAGGSISRMNVTGTGAFGAEEDLNTSFNSDRPAIIDASANTGGLDVTLNGHYNVEIQGTMANDELTAESSGEVLINAYDGKNVIVVDDSDRVDITGGSGIDRISAQNGETVTIAAGDGENEINADGSETVDIVSGAGADTITAQNGKTVTIAAGDGDNEIDVDGSETVDIVSGAGADTITAVGSETVMVDSGAGNDDITASALEIDIAAGAGDDNVVVAGLGGGTAGATAGAVNVMMILDDSGSMSGQLIEDLKAAANDMFDQIEDSGVDSAAITIVFGSSATASTWGSIADARAVINALSGSSGGTDYVAALTTAMTAFDTTGALPNATNLNVFISDGYPSPGIDPTLQGQWETFLSNNNIISYAVGIGGLADPAPLEPIAYNGVNGTDIDPILGTGANLSDILSDIAGTIGLAGNNALVNLDLGDGQNIVQLGDDADLAQGLVAQEGSSISGENITLKVEAASDLRAVNLANANITEVVLEADDGSSAPILTLTASQFAAIGAENFKVEGAVFNTHAFIKLIVDPESAGADGKISLDELGVGDLSSNIDLFLEVKDGITLEMTAEQLHTRVAQNGVTLADDGNTDYLNGSVVITGGGLDFDPFNTSDTVKTVINGTVYYGGSLSDDFAVDGPDAGDIAGDSQNEWYNVKVQSVYGGYDRPADYPVVVSLTIDSNVTPVVPIDPEEGFETWHTNLAIIGDQDITFTAPVELGMIQGVPTNPFNVDFSALQGKVINFTLDNFELLAQGGSITGNADNGYSSEVLIHIANDPRDPSGGDPGAADGSENFGWDENGAQSLVSQGVERYIVTQIDGPTAPGSPGNEATIILCDTAQDIETFGLRGNYNDTLNLVDAAWGLAFELQGGGTAKADGPTGTANVGALVANYEWDGADAVVNLTHSVANDTRPIHAAGIDIDNADSITINSDSAKATIDSVAGDSVETLDLNAAGNLTIVDELPTNLEIIDGAGVTGHLTLTLDDEMAEPFTLTAGTGGLTLTLDGEDAADFEGSTIDAGAGLGTLIVDGNFDLSEATLLDIDKVVLKDDATLWLQMSDADAIGAGDFSLAEGADNATLNLVGLDGEPFAVANYAEGITVDLLILADDPVVTLHTDTDLTGIGGLVVPEGTILNLTAEQFQQLTDRTITGLDDDGNVTADFTVNITGLTQADVDRDLNGDGDSDDADENLDLSGVAAANKTIALAENVALEADDNLGTAEDLFDVIMGDGITLTLADILQADGLNVNITDAANTILEFTDIYAGPFESIDASGFDVDILRILNVLVANRNVDLMFLGLPEDVEKVIYNDLGWVEGQTQHVVIEEGTTIPGFIVFNKPEADFEIRDFVLDMEGGAEIGGNLRLSASDNENGLLQNNLKTVTINSNLTTDDPATGDVVEGENRLTGETYNIITGDLTSRGMGWMGQYWSVDNDLLDVTINAEQDFILTGDIVFESVTAGNNPLDDDGIAANDDYEAEAVLTVNGDADVSLGDLEIDDDDVDSLVVNHTGGGTLVFELDGNHVNDDPVNNNVDLITINGGAGTTIARISDEIDLSDDNIGGADQLLLEPDAVLTLDVSQLLTIGYTDISVVTESGDPADDTDPTDNADLHLVGLGTGDLFDATQLDVNINLLSITLDPGDVVLDPSVNLTGVGQLIVQEGGSLTLTAAQFQQLAGIGAITVLDDPNVDLETTVNITDLTQADVDIDLNGDGDTTDAGETFDLGNVAVDNLTVTLAEDVYLDDDADLNNAEMNVGDGLTLGLANWVQADGLVVNGGVDSTVIFQFDSVPTVFTQIDASGYDITTLKALATFIGGLNAEFTIDDLPSSVELRLYQDPEELGFLSPTHRVVFIEEDVIVPNNTALDALIFNDWDPTDEVRTLSITMDGGVEIQGDISLPTRIDKDGGLVQQFFETLTLISQGAEANLIDGDIDTQPSLLIPPNTSENNLLDVIINATQELVIDGDIVFNSIDVPDDDAVASLMVLGTADVTIEQLVTTDVDIATLELSNMGTGVLTITGGSPAFDGDNTEELMLTGTGDMVFGTNPDVTTEWGVSADDLSLIDASGLSGDLDLGVVDDVDNTDFTFISGTGVTTMTMIDDTLDVGPGTVAGVDTDGDGIDDIDENGWTFDFSDAAAGSELHLDSSLTFTKGPLTIDLGANTTLYIDGNPGDVVDLTDIDLTIIQGLDIVLADEVTLVLTADQADGLSIVAGPDTGATGITAQVNIEDLGDYSDLNANGKNDDLDELVPYDFSGIAEDIAGNATLADDDVTLHVDTNLGYFTIQLDCLVDNVATDLSGQTIRFATVAQAQRAIVVTGDDGDGSVNSTNVVWLFTTIDDVMNPDGVDTVDYDPGIGRLLFSEDLVNNEGGLVENLFTTLPSSILRVDFATLQELDILLSSEAVNRVIELSSFVDIADLTFSDDDVQPEEHIETLTIVMGGEVEVDDIAIDDVVAAADTDPASVQFNLLTIDSRVALHQDHYMATEDYINDNDGLNETGENVQPDPVNTLGNIGVGASNGVDLLDVVINTYGVAVYGAGGTPVIPVYDVNDGADLVAATLTFDSEVAGETANLDINGANDVTFKSIDTTDADIAALVVDTTGHTGVFTVTGGSPAANVDNTESLTINPGDAGVVFFGYAWDDDDNDGVVEATDGDGIVDPGEHSLNLDAADVPYAGVAGEELSLITVTGTGEVYLGVLAQIDGTDDDTDGDTVPDQDAFFLNGNDKATTFAILGEGDVDGTPTSPSLDAGNTWRFEDVNLTISETTAPMFVTGGTLELTDVDLIIDGDVDLSMLVDDPLTLAVEGLVLSGTTTINVTEGSILRLTVEQVDALQTGGFNVTGEGTVVVTGESDDTDGDIDTDFGNLRTAFVDLSAVTLAATDFDQALNITANGAEDVAGNDLVVGGVRIAQTIIGSDNNDALTVDATANDGNEATIDVITRLGADTGDIGDPMDTPTGVADPAEVAGDTITKDTSVQVRIEVDAGFDQIDVLDGEPANTDQDVVVVPGTEFYAAGVTNGGFIANSDTTNGGVAVIESDGSVDETIDLSAAGGAEGWYLIGAPDLAFGDMTTLIGSNQDDILIDGLADTADNDGEEDTLSGNDDPSADDADLFIFNVAKSDVAEATATVVAEGADYEEITVNNTFSGATLRFEFIIDGIAPAFVTITDPGTDFATTDGVAAALNDAINARSDATSTVDGSVVTARGIDGRQFDLQQVVEDPNGVANNVTASFIIDELDDFGDYADDPTDTGDASIPNDDRTEMTINFTGAVTEGEEYTITVQRSDGSSYEGNHTVAAGENLQDVVDALAEDLNTSAGGDQGFYSVGFGTVPGDATQTGAAAAFQIVAYDIDQKDGGFTINGLGGNVLAGTSSVVALSSSSILDGSETSLDDADADVITDFSSGEGDQIDIGDLPAGTSANYDEGAEVANFATALADANAAMETGKMYYLTSTAADEGLLFYDANADGNADGVLQLIGVNNTNFDYTDIAA